MDTKVWPGFVFALLLTVAQSVRAADEPAVAKEAAVLLEQIVSDPRSGSRRSFCVKLRAFSSCRTLSKPGSA